MGVYWRGAFNSEWVLNGLFMDLSSISEQPECKGFDIGFILDASTSVTNLYGKAKELLKSLVRKFTNNNDRVQISVVSFSDYAMQNIKFNTYSDSKRLNKTIDEIPLINSLSRIDVALRMAQNEMFTSSNGARSKARKILIVLTDGSQSNYKGYENPVAVSNELRNNNIEIIAVGFGKTIDVEKLQGIAGGKDNTYFFPSQYNSINIDVVDELTKLVPGCDTPG